MDLPLQMEDRCQAVVNREKHGVEIGVSYGCWFEYGVTERTDERTNTPSNSREKTSIDHCTSEAGIISRSRMCRRHSALLSLSLWTVPARRKVRCCWAPLEMCLFLGLTLQTSGAGRYTNPVPTTFGGQTFGF